MPELLAYCGIECDACPALTATRTNDAALRAKTATEWSKMFGHNLKPEEINCTGCASDGAHLAYCESMCEIRKCTRGRKLAHCAACADYGCATLAGFLKNAPEARTRLEAIRAKSGGA